MINVGKEIVVPIPAATIFDAHVNSPIREPVTKISIALYAQENLTDFEQHIVRKLYERGVSLNTYQATVSSINRAFEGIAWSDDIFDDIYNNYVPDIFDTINTYIGRYKQPHVTTKWEQLLTWPSRAIRHATCKIKLNWLCDDLYLSEYDCYKYAITNSASECYRQVIRGAIFASLLLERHKNITQDDEYKAEQLIEDFPLYDY
jgi:hypothetical protein